MLLPGLKGPSGSRLSLLMMGGVLLATFCAIILVRFPRRDSNMSKQADWAVELAFCFVLWVVEADIEVPKFLFKFFFECLRGLT